MDFYLDEIFFLAGVLWFFFIFNYLPKRTDGGHFDRRPGSGHFDRFILYSISRRMLVIYLYFMCLFAWCEPRGYQKNV